MTESSPRLQIDELIVVEGIHDRQRVEAAVNADVLVIGGDRIGQRVMDAIRRGAAHRGVIVFTDPDGAGERIRRRIDQAVPGCKHAHLPRRQAVSSHGLGVEHASVAHIQAALQRARPATSGEVRQAAFAQADMLKARLVACEEAVARRTALGDLLGIGYGNAKSFLHKLNVLGVTREQFEAALEMLDKRG